MDIQKIKNQFVTMYEILHRNDLVPDGVKETYYALQAAAAPQQEVSTPEVEGLQQRVEELEAEVRKYELAITSPTPGGSEYVNDPTYCAEFVKEQSKERDRQFILKIKECKELQQRIAELEAERGNDKK
jgi:BMFP domain-containing protein YqiC